MGFGPSFAVVCALWVVWGLAYGPEEVVAQLAFVRSIPDEFQGRVFSLMTVVFSSATLVGSAVAGPLTDATSPQAAMLVAGGIFLAATISAFGIGRSAEAFKRVKLSA